MASPFLDGTPWHQPRSREVSVFVHPLPRDYSAAELRQAAQQAGIDTITDAWIPRRQPGQQYGYLRFGSRDDAVAAMDKMQQLDVDTKPTAVLGNPKPRRPKTPGGGHAAPTAGGPPKPGHEAYQIDLQRPWDGDGWGLDLAQWIGGPAVDLGGLDYRPGEHGALGLGGYVDYDSVPRDDFPRTFLPLLGAAGYPVAVTPLVDLPGTGGWPDGDADAGRPSDVAPATVPRTRSAPPLGRADALSVARSAGPLPAGSPDQPGGSSPSGGEERGNGAGGSICATGELAVASLDCPAERELALLGLTVSAVPRGRFRKRRALAGMLAATRRMLREYDA